MSALFPNVPQVPGVPPILLGPGYTPAIPVALTADSITAALGLASNQWGVFDQNHNPIILADSVVEVAYRRDFQISDYPIEQGGFSSYNKVRIPFDARVTFAKGGMDSDRAAFLSSIQSVAGDLNLYNVICPDDQFLNVNVMHVDYRRRAQNGVGLLLVEVWLQEIRISATSSFTNTASPSGADPVNVGTVQTTAPTAAESYFGLYTGASGSWE